MDAASQQAYYLPDASGVGNHDQQYYGYDSMTGSSTVQGYDAPHDYDECLSLSGTTQAGEQPAAKVSSKPEQAASTPDGVLEHLRHSENSAPLFGELLPAFNKYVGNPFIRAANRTHDAAIDPRLHRSANTNPSGIQQVTSWDFVHQIRPVIDIRGTFQALFELDVLTLNNELQGGFVRQWTSGDDLLCGLHALVISLNAKLAPNLVARDQPPFTVRDLQNIIAGDRYRQLCARRIHNLANGPHPHTAESLALHAFELSAPRNLSVEQLTFVVYIVGEMIGHPLQLGVVASTAPDPEGNPSSLYDVYQINFNDNAGATTIWLVNENYGGDALNHWSGMAPDAAASHSRHAQVAKQPPQTHHQPDVQRRKRAPAKKVANMRTRNTASRARRNVPPPSPAEPVSPPPANAIYCPHSDCKRYHSAQNPKPFKDNRALVHHENTVHLPYHERRHHCDACHERFVYPKDLKRHNQGIHDKDYPQWCLVAGCAMSGDEHRQRGSNLWRHYQNVHGDMPELWERCRRHFGLGDKGQAAPGSAATSPAASHVA